MNLYSIYDSDSGLRLGKNKTAVQIASLFGVKKENVYRAAVSGHILSGKYRIELTCENIRKKDDLEKMKLLSTWDEVVRPLREYFRRVRLEAEVTH